MMRRGLTVTAIACGVVAAGTAEAKKSPMTLRELVKASALIVVAQVESVTVADHEKTYDFGWKAHTRTATARVMQT